MFGDPRLPDRFWDKVMTEPNTGCWLWTGRVDGDRFPRFEIGKRGKSVSSTMLAFDVFVGYRRGYRRMLFHRCGEVTCCNPDHLFQKVKEENKRTQKLAASRRWRTRNPEVDLLSWDSRTPAQRTAQYKRNRLKRYGLSEAAFDRMMLDQDGKCAICRCRFAFEHSPANRKNEMHIDHDHATGAVRGLLCNNCNLGIGMFADDCDRMVAAVEYLKKAGG